MTQYSMALSSLIDSNNLDARAQSIEDRLRKQMQVGSKHTRAGAHTHTNTQDTHANFLMQLKASMLEVCVCVCAWVLWSVYFSGVLVLFLFLLLFLLLCVFLLVIVVCGNGGGVFGEKCGVFFNGYHPFLQEVERLRQKAQVDADHTTANTAIPLSPLTPHTHTQSHTPYFQFSLSTTAFM